jgi:hypothetical protein
MASPKVQMLPNNLPVKLRQLQSTPAAAPGDAIFYIAVHKPPMPGKSSSP